MQPSTPLLFALAAALSACVPPTATFDPQLYDSAPIARLNAPVTAALDRPLVLDGSASYDPDGDGMTWNWRIHQSPPDSALPPNPFLANGDRNAEVTSFVPDVLGRYTVALTVGAANLESDSTYAVVEVVPDGTVPTADAGPDKGALEGIEVCLDGTNSWDPLGVPLSHSWSLASRPDDSGLTTTDLDASDQSEVCFVPDAAGVFTLSLSVAAGPRIGIPDYVDIVVQSTNQPPTALGEVLNANSCDYLQFDGTGSTDPDGDALTYRWSLLLAPPGSIAPLGEDAFDDPSAAAPSLYADVEGEFIVELLVFDGESWSPPSLIEVSTSLKEVNAAPVIEHQGDIYFANTPSPCNASCPPVQALLDASGTVDPDGDLLSVGWEVVSGDANIEDQEGLTTQLTISGLQGSCLSGVPTSETVTVRVTATDCSGDVDSGEIVVLYECGVGL